MTARISQRDRLNNAIAELRTTGPLRIDIELHQLDAAARSQFAKRLLAQKWTTRNFYRLRTTITPSWRGDELTVLHELSYYLLPRQTWAVRRSGGESWVRREQVYTFVALVQHKFGREAGSALRKTLTRNGVKYRPRRTLSAAQKEALKERQFKKQVVELTKALGSPGPRKTMATAIATVLAKPGRRRINLDD